MNASTRRCSPASISATRRAPGSPGRRAARASRSRARSRSSAQAAQDGAQLRAVAPLDRPGLDPQRVDRAQRPRRADRGGRRSPRPASRRAASRRAARPGRRVGEDQVRDHARLALQPVILLLHHRYRHAGGEERAVEDLAWLIREHLGEDVEVLERALGGGRAPRRGARAASPAGCAPRRSPRPSGAPARGSCTRTTSTRRSAPRALEAAREAGARVVLHLHNYRLVCAVGTCFTRGEDCTRCHGRNTLPGLRLNCRGGSRAESAAYAAGLALLAAAAGGGRRRDRRAERVRARPPARRSARRWAQDARARLGPARRSPSARRAADGEFVLAAGRLTPGEGLRRRRRRVRAGRACRS